MTKIISCPCCQKKFSADETYSNKRIICDECGQTFTAPIIEERERAREPEPQKTDIESIIDREYFREMAFAVIFFIKFSFFLLFASLIALIVIGIVTKSQVLIGTGIVSLIFFRGAFYIIKDRVKRGRR